MKATLIIETMDNAAFEDNEAYETGRILKELGNLLMRVSFNERFDRDLYDINGYRVGYITIE